MTTVFFLHFSVGTSGAQAVATDDLFEQCQSAVSESVCQPDTTMQQHTEKDAVTLRGTGNGKMLGKRVMLRLHGTKYNRQVCNTVLLFSLQLYENIEIK